MYIFTVVRSTDWWLDDSISSIVTEPFQYKYKKSPYEDETIWGLFYLHKGISYSSEMSSFCIGLGPYFLSMLIYFYENSGRLMMFLRYCLLMVYHTERLGNLAIHYRSSHECWEVRTHWHLGCLFNDLFKQTKWRPQKCLTGPLWIILTKHSAASFSMSWSHHEQS